MEPGGRDKDASGVFAQGGVQFGHHDACGQLVLVAPEHQAVPADDDARGVLQHDVVELVRAELPKNTNTHWRRGRHTFIA